MKLVRDLAEGSDHFRMPGMPDQNQLITLRIVPVDFIVNFDDERTGGIDHVQPSALRFFPHRFRDTVGAKNNYGPFGNFIELLHEYGSLLPQGVDHMPAVHNFVADIDRCAILLE